jgi:hypothetical protein
MVSCLLRFIYRLYSIFGRLRQETMSHKELWENRRLNAHGGSIIMIIDFSAARLSNNARFLYRAAQATRPPRGILAPVQQNCATSFENAGQVGDHQCLAPERLFPEQ